MTKKSANSKKASFLKTYKQNPPLHGFVLSLLIILLGIILYNIWIQQSVKQQTNSLSSDNFFVVRELDIEFQIPADLKDLVYTTTNTNGVIAANFSTITLTNLAKTTGEINGNNYCNATNAGLGIIEKNIQMVNDYTDYTKIGEYYYFWHHPETPCLENTSLIKLQTKQSAELGNAFKTIRPIQ